VLLVAVSVIGIALTAAVPAWRHQAQREQEAELVFRGEQYARAIALYARRTNGALPPNLDVLVDARFLRRRYADPMTGEGAFVPVPGPGGIAAVTSRSDEPSIRVYHGASRYKDWRFGPRRAATAPQTRPR
jgi:type II secretory pathway pseudopilin PulG